MTRQNPNSTGMIVMLGAVAVAAYGYMAGWFTTATAATTVLPPSTPTTGTSATNPINAGTQLVNTPSTPPPLGTVVSDANGIAAQAAAGYAYILPAQSLTNIMSLTPNGYSNINTTDYGSVFVRNNVFSAVNADLQNRMQRAINSGASATSVQNSSNLTLAQIVTSMSTNGLTGLYGMAGLGYYNPYGYRN